MTGKKVTATAAPKNPARAVFTVKDPTSKKSLKGARVTIHGTSDNGTTVQVEADSDKNGRATGIFEAGTYDTTVTLDPFGPAPDPDQPAQGGPWENAAVQFLPIRQKGGKAFTNKIEVDLVQTLPRAVIKVVDPSRNNETVIGATVTIGSETGTTDRNGMFTSKGLPMGNNEIKLHKNGYGPPAAAGNEPTEGDVSQTVDFPHPVDQPITMQMQNVWGLVRSHDITVGGQNFVEWYNGTFLPAFDSKYPKFGTPKIQSKAAFGDCFDKCERFWEHEIPVEVFVGIFLIFVNETGGTFHPGIGERGSPKYFFEPLKTATLNKASYNQGQNRRAGDLLLKRGVLKEPDDHDAIIAWNQTHPYPDPHAGSDLENAAKECDFYKYRGHGLVQLTWFAAYLKTVYPHLKERGYVSADLSPEDAMDSITTEQMEDHIRNDSDVFYPMVRDFLRSISSAVHGLNSQDWWTMGKRVSGGNLYADIYKTRCTELYAAMVKETFVLE